MSRPSTTRRSGNTGLTPASPPRRALAPTDARWVFAARVAAQLDAGRAAVLRPERRERLMKTASLLGIRPFDASLIIAMVQDTARRGEAAPGHPPLTPALAERLDAVPEARPEPPRAGVAQLASMACLIAAGLVALGILWLQGGAG